jgi:hypothetical protein
VSSWPRIASSPGVSLSLTLAFHPFCGRRFWAGGHRTAALSFLPGFHPCAPIREKDLDEPDLQVCNYPRYPPWAISCSFSASKPFGLRQSAPLTLFGDRRTAAIAGLLAARPGAPSAGLHSRLHAYRPLCGQRFWNHQNCFSSWLIPPDVSCAILRELPLIAARKPAAVAFPCLLLGETMYRAALPNSRSSSSDIFLSRVRIASTSKVVSWIDCIAVAPSSLTRTHSGMHERKERV